ncbi:MAG: MBL fold metallo-hydrolase [Rhodospirillaceae bacterium]|nr:MBL fold metallo-hydrolase [Rhodospirillaceae bacterium]
MTYKPDYVFEGEPAPGETREVAPGVWWLRMPLPFALNHINLWILEDGDGWTIVDTGVQNDEIKACWETIEKKHFTAEKPLKRVIVTHFHPDHVGLAGWLCERHGVELTMTLAEWTQTRMNIFETQESKVAQMMPFYKKAGFDAEQMESVKTRGAYYGRIVSTPPTRFNRVEEHDEIMIDGHAWRVIITEGHALKHACLYCADKKVLISGDQILPRITPNISLQPQEPDLNPLQLFIDSLDKFRDLPADTLVLPSHDWPFQNLLERLDCMAEHHDERLDAALAAITEPATGVDVLNALFKRELDNHQIFFAIGEALAHVHKLMADGKATRTLAANGVYRYQAVGAMESAA